MDFTKINERYKKVSYHLKPEDLTVAEWQYALRKQYGETHTFQISKTGKRPVFDDYTLSNPEATQKLISTIIQKDQTDGKTYLKIPIENQKVVEDAFALFAGLLGGLKR